MVVKYEYARFCEEAEALARISQSKALTSLASEFAVWEVEHGRRKVSFHFSLFVLNSKQKIERKMTFLGGYFKHLIGNTFVVSKKNVRKLKGESKKGVCKVVEEESSNWQEHEVSFLSFSILAVEMISFLWIDISIFVAFF